MLRHSLGEDEILRPLFFVDLRVSGPNSPGSMDFKVVGVDELVETCQRLRDNDASLVAVK